MIMAVSSRTIAHVYGWRRIGRMPSFPPWLTAATL
jgi:hypothetical protein